MTPMANVPTIVRTVEHAPPRVGTLKHYWNDDTTIVRVYVLTTVSQVMSKLHGESVYLCEWMREDA